MTLNRRRAALSAVIIAAIIGWAGAGVASASNKWDAVPDSNSSENVSDSNKWDLVSFSNKWD